VSVTCAIAEPAAHKIPNALTNKIGMNFLAVETVSPRMFITLAPSQLPSNVIWTVLLAFLTNPT
jgi:hypothetical protein